MPDPASNEAVLAVIPARGGSKRIPRKNVRPFCGKPMLAWAIEVAKRSGLFGRIIVSTDDDEIAGVALQWGAEVPFRRPAELADDHAGMTEAIRHATLAMLESGHRLDAVCCVFATAPFLQVEDLRRGLSVLRTGNWDYVISAAEYASPVFRAFCKLPEGGVRMIFPEHYDVRSQDLPKAFHDAAQFYWGAPAAWIERRPLFDYRSAIVPIPRWRVQDIDSEEDWQRAELLHRLIVEGGFHVG